MHHQLLRVLLDPLSYCDPGRMPCNTTHAAPVRAALNRALIRHYRLSATAHTLELVGAREREVLAAWFYLRRCAYLLGAYCYRNSVLQYIGFQHCDPGLQRFLMLSLSGIPEPSQPRIPDECSLLAQGLEVLEPWLRPLSPAWQERIALQFPKEVARPAPGKAVLNRTLITLALHHAKTT